LYPPSTDHTFIRSWTLTWKGHEHLEIKVLGIIICFGDAAAYRVYVYMLYRLQGGRSPGYCARWEALPNAHISQATDLPATDTTYTHTHDILLHHWNI